MAEEPVLARDKDGNVFDTGFKTDGAWKFALSDGKKMQFSDAFGNLTVCGLPEPTTTDEELDAQPRNSNDMTIPHDGKWHRLIFVRSESANHGLIIDVGPPEDGQPF